MGIYLTEADADISRESYEDPERALVSSINSPAPNRMARNFWIAWLICLAVTLGGAAILNYVVDPFSIYGSGVFEPYRENSYITKAEQFENLAVKPQVLIIGSSRVGSMDPRTVTEITGKSCYNWSVPSAGVEITSAIVHMAVERYGAELDTVIVGIDPEAFHPEMTIHAQARLAPMYVEYIGEVGAWVRLKEFALKTLRLVTMEQTAASIKVLKREMGMGSEEVLVLYRDDGFALYTPKEEAIAAGTYDLEAVVESRLTRYPDENLTITGSTVPSVRRMQQWEEFLDYCTEQGIKVIAYMPPDHPDYVELLERFGSIPVMEEISEFIGESVESRGGIYRDYTYLESFGGESDQFYDEVHMRKGNNDRLLYSLTGNEYRTVGPGAI